MSLATLARTPPTVAPQTIELQRLAAHLLAASGCCNVAIENAEAVGDVRTQDWLVCLRAIVRLAFEEVSETLERH